MRLFIISSAFLIVFAACGYPVAENVYPTPPPKYATTPSYQTPPTYPTTPSYPLPKKYPVAPTYPTPSAYPSPSSDYAQKPSYSAPPPPPPPSPSGYSSNSFGDSEVASLPSYSPSATDYNSPGTFRQRAKASVTRNFHRRPLQPVRRFQQKKQ